MATQGKCTVVWYNAGQSKVKRFGSTSPAVRWLASDHTMENPVITYICQRNKPWNLELGMKPMRKALNCQSECMWLYVVSFLIGHINLSDIWPGL
jgi:hypothetical protein